MIRRAVLWDMDGTLIDSEPVHAVAFAAAVQELGLTVPDDFNDRLIGSSAEQVHRALVAQTDAAIGFDDWLALKWRHYIVHSDAIPRRDSVSDVAEDLARRGVPMAVVSNSTADEVELCLRATDLTRIIPVTVSRTELQRGKPEPDGYLLAAERLGCAPENCLVVEDSILGAQAGLAAGMSVLFHPQHATPGGNAPPQGAFFLGPDGDVYSTIDRFVTTGRLHP